MGYLARCLDDEKAAMLLHQFRWPALRSNLKVLVAVATTIRKHKAQIRPVIRLGVKTHATTVSDTGGPSWPTTRAVRNVPRCTLVYHAHLPSHRARSTARLSTGFTLPQSPGIYGGTCPFPYLAPAGLRRPQQRP